MGSIPNPLFAKGEHISLGESSVFSSLDKIDYPLFCFRHLHKDYNIDECLRADKSFSRQLLKRIGTSSQMSWSEIKFADRRGHGTEKISCSSIKKSIPSTITEDVKDFLSFYFNGTKGRLIGFKNQMVFHVVYIDTKLEVYNH